MKIAQNNIS